MSWVCLIQIFIQILWQYVTEWYQKGLGHGLDILTIFKWYLVL